MDKDRLCILAGILEDVTAKAVTVVSLYFGYHLLLAVIKYFTV